MKVSSLIFLLLFFFAILSTSAIAKTSMWKVSKQNQVLYLGGTIHLLPQSAYPLPPEFEQAFAQAKIVVLEADISQQKSPAYQQKVMSQLRYADGKSLSDFVSEATQNTLKTYLMPFGISYQHIAQFKPGFLGVMLLTLELQKAQLAGEGVDGYFANLAPKQNKSTQFLETLDFQLGLLAELGHGNEDAFITSSIEQMSDYPSLFKQTLDAWRQGDLATIEKLLITPLFNSDPDTYKIMMSDRNKSWLPKLVDLLQTAEIELVLVGVGHLTGSDNLLSLLQQQGYQVEQL